MNEEPRAKVQIEYTRSSSRDGGEGFRIAVTDEATPKMVAEVEELAAQARRLCRETLRLDVNEAPA